MRMKKGLAYLLTTVMTLGMLIGVPARGSVAEAATTSVTCGNLTLSGESLGESDYSYDSSTGKITILSDKAITISGTTYTEYIYIDANKNANLTLSGLVMYLTGANNGKTGVPGIAMADNSTGNVSITLMNTNQISCRGAAGIQKNGSMTNTLGKLSFSGTGILKVIALAQSNDSSKGYAAIGGGSEADAANIEFNSGTIYAVSRSAGAAIGGGYNGDGTNIVINNGNVNAITGGLLDTVYDSRMGAGIGGGANGAGKNITINNGNINARVYEYVEDDGSTPVTIASDATDNGILYTLLGSASMTQSSTSVYGGAGIGGGYGGSASNIVINGGKVFADGDSAREYAMPGIGGVNADITEIVINGGQVTANGGGDYGAGIGSGTGSSDPNVVKNVGITITGGTITATGGSKAPGIGAGQHANANIYISGGNVLASAGDTAYDSNNLFADDVGLGSQQYCYNSSKYTKQVVYAADDTTEVSQYVHSLTDAAAFTAGNIVLQFKNTDGTDYSYGMNDVIPVDGKLYLYLKSGVVVTEKSITQEEEEDVNSVQLKYNGSTEKTSWYTGSVTISAEGYSISDNKNSGFSESYELTTSGSGTVSKKLYFKNTTSNKVLSDGRTVEVNIDNAAPTGTLTIDGVTYKTINGEGSKICHLSNMEVGLTTSDAAGSGVADVAYAYSDTCYNTRDAVEAGITSWTTGTPQFQSGKAIYVRITDNVGMVTYLSTPVITNDNVPPTINVVMGTATDDSQTCTITVADTGSSAINYAYALRKSSETSLTNWEEIVNAGKSGTTTSVVNGIFEDLEPNTEYTLYVMVNDGLMTLAQSSNPNYSNVGMYTFKTTKVSTQVSNQVYSVKSGVANSYTYDLSKFLTASNVDSSKMGTITYSAVAGSGEILSESGAVTVNGSELVMNVKDSFDAGKTQDITITIKSDNYEDITATLTVKSVSKTPVILSDADISVANVTYDGAPKAYSGELKWMNENDECAVTGTKVIYEGYNSTSYSASEVAPSNAGDYKVTFTVYEDDTNYEGTATYYFTIAKADISDKMTNTAWYINDTKVTGSSVSVIKNAQTYKVKVAGYSDMVSPVYSGTQEAGELGTYEVKVEFSFVNDTYANNYKLPDSMTLVWKILDKVTPDVSLVEWIYKQGTIQADYKENITELVENGTAYTVEVTGLPEGVQAEYSGICSAISAGEYQAVVTFKVTDETIYKEPNPSTLTLCWKIVKQDTGEGSGSSEEEQDKNVDAEDGDNTGEEKTNDTNKESNNTQDVTTSADTNNTASNEAADVDQPAIGTEVKDGTNNYKVLTLSATSGTVEYLGPTDKKVLSVVIPESIVINNQVYVVDSIAKNAFKGCTKLTKVTIGKNVKTIGNGAFSGCKALKTVTISSDAELTKIGDKAFYKCTSLKKITISKNVTTIGKSAFEGCKKLSAITIKSKNLKKVGSKAIKNIYKKAKIKCPNKAYVTKYKKLFKSKTGYKKTMKISK